MENQKAINYARIASAIDFVKEYFHEQPSLAAIAEHVHVSPDHFQRIFQEWAGTSPKKFLQYTSLQHAKSLLRKDSLSLFDTSYRTGLSSTSRLHDMFVSIEGMTPAEYKNGGQALDIAYGSYPSIFGDLVIGSTSKGVCYLAFEDEEQSSLSRLFAQYPNAKFMEAEHPMHDQVLSFFSKTWTDLPQVKLHLRGTDFQLKVWEALLKIPSANLSTYQEIASEINRSKSSRAVGNAIGANPIAYLIPCHRVIKTSGLLGGYRWGTSRKSLLIAWEAAIKNTDIDETI